MNVYRSIHFNVYSSEFSCSEEPPCRFSSILNIFFGNFWFIQRRTSDSETVLPSVAVSGNFRWRLFEGVFVIEWWVWIQFVICLIPCSYYSLEKSFIFCVLQIYFTLIWNFIFLSTCETRMNRECRREVFPSEFVFTTKLQNMNISLHWFHPARKVASMAECHG